MLFSARESLFDQQCVSGLRMLLVVKTNVGLPHLQIVVQGLYNPW